MNVRQIEFGERLIAAAAVVGTFFRRFALLIIASDAKKAKECSRGRHLLLQEAGAAYSRQNGLDKLRADTSSVHQRDIRSHEATRLDTVSVTGSTSAPRASAPALSVVLMPHRAVC